MRCPWLNGKEQVKMTKEQIDLILETAVYNKLTYPQWRQGQSVFNSAFELFPYEANQLRGTAHDCFYDDDLIDEFLSNLGAQDDK